VGPVLELELELELGSSVVVVGAEELVVGGSAVADGSAVSVSVGEVDPLVEELDSVALVAAPASGSLAQPPQATATITTSPRVGDVALFTALPQSSRGEG